MSNYYVAVNGQQTGPFPQHELIMRGVTPTTLVWCDGMADWQQAGTVPELMYLFANGQQSGYQQPGYQQVNQPQQHYMQQPYMQQPQAPYGQPSYGQQHTNYKTLAIIATVIGALFSCVGLIFGAIAIGKADSANKAYAMGDEYNGDMYNKSAKTFVIVAFVLSAIGFFGSILYIYNVMDLFY